MPVLPVKPLAGRTLELDVSWTKPNLFNKPDFGSLRLILRDNPCSYWTAVTFGIVADMGGEREVLCPEWEFPSTWATRKSVRAEKYPAALTEHYIAKAWGMEPLTATLVNCSVESFFNTVIEETVQPYMSACADYSLTRRQARRAHRALYEVCTGLDFSC